MEDRDGKSWLSVERRPGETLRAGLEQALHQAIWSGALRPGLRLPSSRTLAAQLGISRGVVSEAYAQLVAQGRLVARRKAAPVVAAATLPEERRLQGVAAPPPRYNLAVHRPDLTQFPVGAWTRVYGDALRGEPIGAFDYGGPLGEPPLRQALAERLGLTRGVVADPDRVLIVSGTSQGIDLLARVFRRLGARRVAVEDPSYPGFRASLQREGLDVVGQPLDREGVMVRGLDADAALVAPAHQFPTGVVLGSERRRELLAWGRERDAYIIEDDYDAEFRYDGGPVRALQGVDSERVVYVGTASKTLAPALRLGWIVLPDRLVDEAARIKRLLDVCSPPLDQRALARFIAGGQYDRHIRRMSRLYRRRRDALLAAFARHLPEVPVEGATGGLHVLARLPQGSDDRAVVAEAARAGLHVLPLTHFRITHAIEPGLVLGYGRISEQAIDGAVRVLADVIHDPFLGKRALNGQS